MTEIATRSPESIGGIAAGSIGRLAVGMVAGHLVLGSSIDHQSQQTKPIVFYRLAPSTHSDHTNLFATVPLALAAPSIESFYADLLSKQERLGKEFEQVLFANLWNLYAR
jgi:hypothetical protein